MARILITNFHPRGGGGHVSYIKALTKIADYSNHIVAVAAPEQSRIYQYLKDKSYPNLYSCYFPGKIQKELPSIIRSAQKFRKIVDHFKPDIVHTNGGPDLFISLWSHGLTNKFNIIRTHHAINHIGNDPYHRYIYSKRVTANIYVSESSYLLSTADGLIPNNNREIIENGVDVRAFAPIPQDLTLTHKHRIFPETFCFGSCAGTGGYKRVDVIIRAAATLTNCNRPFKILVLGEKSSGSSLSRLANSLGVTQFEYCGFHKNIIPYISLFDAGFILSDSIETISFAAREMMSMGKPLISSSFSGLKENVIEGINGYLVEPGNVEETAEAMSILINMKKEKLAILSASAREYAISNFDILDQIKSHVSLYDRLTR